MRLVLLLLFAGLTASNLHAQQQNLIKAYKSPKDTNILDPEGVKHIVLSDDEDLESIDQFLNVTHVQVKGEILDNVASQSQVCLMGEVRFLDLSNNDLSELPTGFSCVNKLTTIVLNQNRIEDIPAILDFERLDEIYLNSNKLSQVPKSIAKKTSLKKLYLDNNDIEKLNSLSKHQLTNLSVANNRILQLPKNFESIQTLKFLDISGNGVADLSSFYVSMMDLEELNLSENEFTEIPEDIFALRNLKALDLSKNKIE
ncbi:MAG: protein phosphatase 1 regulatory subunit 42, partial [Flavobacteriales bacterium]|nr:protein phosphatase 1 regulatory subunit 42 [Flavobacteriales bacterium]